MTDDIVTRLRNRVAFPREYVFENSTGDLILKAADEIERLRKTLALAVDERDKLLAEREAADKPSPATVDRVADLHDQIVQLVSGYND